MPGLTTHSRFFRIVLALALFLSLLMWPALVYAAYNVTTVDSVGDVGGHTSLTLNAAGNPVISYYDFTNNDLKVAVCGNLTCSSGVISTTIDSDGIVGWHSSLRLNASGNPVISYYDYTNSNLKVAVCGNSTCTSGNTVSTVDSSGSVGDYSSLALNASGNPVISYEDFNNTVLKVAVCGNPTCTSGTVSHTVDSNWYVGRYTSLALNAAGNPVISYHDYTHGDLKVAVCSNPTCNGGTAIQTVDSVGDVGTYTSLKLNAAGNPVISYRDDTNTALKVAVCGNPTCSSGNTVTTVDSSGSVGDYSSLALNASGNPVISYSDSTNGNLKVASCGNATCTSGNTFTSVDGGAYTSLALNSYGSPVISYYANSNLKVAVDILAPEIVVLGNGVEITDGDNTPSLTDHTDFGNLTLGAALTHTFTISNLNTDNLYLTGSPLVTFTGAAASDFTVVVSPTTPVISNTTTSFQVRFTPSVTGTRAVTLSLANNDSDENPYDFAIQGTGNDVPISGLSGTNNGPTLVGHATSFTATISAGSNVSYTWNFGDNHFGSGAAVTHTYVTTGTFTAIVTATNSVNNLSASTLVTITNVRLLFLPIIRR